MRKYRWICYVGFVSLLCYLVCLVIWLFCFEYNYYYVCSYLYVGCIIVSDTLLIIPFTILLTGNIDHPFCSYAHMPVLAIIITIITIML